MVHIHLWAEGKQSDILSRRSSTKNFLIPSYWFIPLTRDYPEDDGVAEDGRDEDEGEGESPEDLVVTPLRVSENKSCRVKVKYSARRR